MKDKPNKLDDVIREKMTNLGATYRPETWDQLSDRLDAVDAEVDPMDESIRDKMANLTAPYRPETWNWMNDRLDAEEITADPLDGVVRNKIADLAAPYRPETWDWMNDRLDELDEGSAAGAEMQTMDEAIYESMHRLEKPYDPNHWPMLLKKLEANAYIGEHIVRYKAMELSLLLLLLLTFIRLPFNTHTSPTPAQPFHQPGPQVQLETDTPESNTLAASKVPGAVALKSKGDNTNTKENSTDLAANAPYTAENTIADIKEFGPDLMDGQEPTTREIIAGQRLKISEQGALDHLKLLPTESSKLAVPNEKITADIFTNAKETTPEHSALGVNPANILGLLSYLPSGMARPLCLTCTGKLDKKAQVAKQSTFFRIGMQGGPDYNRVITPSTLVNGAFYQADRYSLGYSGGITFGLEKGRWEIETGLIYSNKRYYALPILVLDGSVEDGFFGNGTKQFDLDVFQVPMNFRYNFYRKNRWRIYAMAGMSLHVATQSNYYLAEADGFTTGGFLPSPSRPGEDNGGRNAPSIKSEFDNFTKGWLEGGSFSENSYLTGNIGLGIEHFLTDYWSIYVQPTYNHSLIYLNNGLGPYYDRIHTNSVIFGFKVRLK